ncbi:MAG: NUDIX hydrolase [Balneolales bacterium]
MKIKAWKISNKSKEFETPIYNVFKNKAMSKSSGIQGDFFVINAPDWVNVIATTPNDEVILVEQYRHGIETVTLEIAGGVIDDVDKDPETAARRELSEETGYTSKKWTNLGKVSTNPAILNNWCHFFLAEDCELTDSLNFDAHEEISVRVIPRKSFLKEVKQGTIHHALVVAAVARLGLHKPEWLKNNH